jgi:hypothetical protein
VCKCVCVCWSSACVKCYAVNVLSIHMEYTHVHAVLLLHVSSVELAIAVDCRCLSLLQSSSLTIAQKADCSKRARNSSYRNYSWHAIGVMPAMRTAHTTSCPNAVICTVTTFTQSQFTESTVNQGAVTIKHSFSQSNSATYSTVTQSTVRECAVPLKHCTSSTQSYSSHNLQLYSVHVYSYTMYSYTHT